LIIDHFRDVVQLDRRGEIVPERRFPGLERGRHHADGSAGKGELAVFAGQAAALHVVEDRLLETRIDASQQHGVVVPFRRQGERGKCRQHPGADGEMQEAPAVELPPQQVAAAGARGRMCDVLFSRDRPRLDRTGEC